MPQAEAVDLDLRDLVLPDSRGTGAQPVGGPGVHVLTLIRHRY